VLHSFSYTEEWILRPPIQGPTKLLWDHVIWWDRIRSVYKVTSAGVFTSSMRSTTPRVDPYCALIQALDGNFYGTTKVGGTRLWDGVQITPAGALTVLYTLT